MKNTTTTRLNTIATCLTRAFMADLTAGFTPESDFTVLRDKVKNHTELELIKGMLLKDKHQVIAGVSAQTGLNMRNVFKTRAQLAYVCNELSTRLRRMHHPLLEQHVFEKQRMRVKWN